MPQFNSVRDAFDYLVNHEWKNLSPEQKEYLKFSKSNFNSSAISEKKMTELLEKYGNLTISVEYYLN